MAEELSYDVIILGAGPAGLQAAIHASRRKVSVLVLGRAHKSSIFKAHVENFCCLHGESGEKLLEQATNKALESGASIMDTDVIQCHKEGDDIVIETESGDRIVGKSLILAMGISRNKLGAKGEKELLGRGVSYCVDCDAGFFRDEPVAIVGNGSAAVSGALTLLFYASHVHLICERLEVSEVLAEKLRNSDIEVHEGRRLVEIAGNGAVKEIVLDSDHRIEVAGVFIELGAKGAVELAGSLGVELDPETMKYIRVDRKQATNIPGVYAGGDICGPPWQVAKAVGEGCVAGLEAAGYAKNRG